MNKVVYNIQTAVFSLWQTMMTAYDSCNGIILGYHMVDDTVQGMSTMTSEPNFKVVLWGESCVGKTLLALRFVEDTFSEKHVTTLQASGRVPIPNFDLMNGLHQHTLIP